MFSKCDSKDKNHHNTQGMYLAVFKNKTYETKGQASFREMFSVYQCCYCYYFNLQSFLQSVKENRRKKQTCSRNNRGWGVSVGKALAVLIMKAWVLGTHSSHEIFHIWPYLHVTLVLWGMKTGRFLEPCSVTA